MYDHRTSKRCDHEGWHEPDDQRHGDKPRHGDKVEARGESTSREHHKHQQSNRSVHTNGTPAAPKPGKPTPGKAAAAKLRHKRRKRKIGA